MQERFEEELMKYHIVSLGCPKNRVDSERFAWIFRSAGYQEADSADSADVVLLNTCAFIAPATEESLEYLQELLAWKGEGPGRKIVLAGCLPGRYADDGTGGLDEIDLILGPEDWKGLSSWLGYFHPGYSGVSGSGSHRYLKIAEGCSNGCAYCTIPSIRGGFRGVSPEIILKEADMLVEQGAREIGLVAQDSGRWESGNMNLFNLAGKLAGIHRDTWFRLYYLHPAHFPSGAEELFASCPNVVPYLDIPVQHASSRILKRMGRGYDESYLRRLMEKIDSMDTEFAVRYTVITGYPGETEEDFTRLRKFLGDYSSARHIAAFQWYPEEGTLEYSRTMKNQDEVEYGTAAERLATVSAVGDALYARWDEKLEGQSVTVLSDDAETGHTVWDAPEVDCVVTFTEKVKPGSFVKVRIVESSGAVLVAEPLSE